MLRRSLESKVRRAVLKADYDPARFQARDRAHGAPASDTAGPTAGPAPRRQPGGRVGAGAQSSAAVQIAAAGYFAGMCLDVRGLSSDGELRCRCGRARTSSRCGETSTATGQILGFGGNCVTLDVACADLPPPAGRCRPT